MDAINYYPFHIGDYAANTAHLEPMEDLAYRRLIDLYYLREAPLPADIQATAKLVRMRSMAADVESVLREFFTLTDDGWRHARCDAEIARMQDKQAKARASALSSVNARRAAAKPVEQHPLNERSTNAVESATTAERTPPKDQADVELPTPTPTPTPIQIPPIPPKGGKPAIGLKAWLDAVKADGKAPIPDDDPVFAYAGEVGIPPEFLRLAWLEFRHRYAQPDAKRYRDWRSVFRKAVRGNWGKLWWLDPSCGQYALTTVGMQAQRAHQERRSA